VYCRTFVTFEFTAKVKSKKEADSELRKWLSTISEVTPDNLYWDFMDWEGFEEVTE